MDKNSVYRTNIIGAGEVGSPSRSTWIRMLFMKQTAYFGIQKEMMF